MIYSFIRLTDNFHGFSEGVWLRSPKMRIFNRAKYVSITMFFCVITDLPTMQANERNLFFRQVQLYLISDGLPCGYISSTYQILQHRSQHRSQLTDGGVCGILTSALGPAEMQVQEWPNFQLRQKPTVWIRKRWNWLESWLGGLWPTVSTCWLHWQWLGTHLSGGSNVAYEVSLWQKLYCNAIGGSMGPACDVWCRSKSGRFSTPTSLKAWTK